MRVNLAQVSARPVQPRPAQPRPAQPSAPGSKHLGYYLLHYRETSAQDLQWFTIALLWWSCGKENSFDRSVYGSDTSPLAHPSQCPLPMARIIYMRNKLAHSSLFTHQYIKKFSNPTQVFDILFTHHKTIFLMGIYLVGRVLRVFVSRSWVVARCWMSRFRYIVLMYNVTQYFHVLET